MRPLYIFLLLIGLILFFENGCRRPECTTPGGHVWGKWQQDPALLGRNGWDQSRQIRFCEKCGVLESGWH